MPSRSCPTPDVVESCERFRNPDLYGREFDELYAVLYRALMPPLCRDLCRFVRPDSAEDAVADLIDEFYDAEFRAKAEWPFVLTVARRKAIDRWRRFERGWRSLPDEYHPTLEAPQYQRIRITQIIEAAESLPDDECSVFFCYECEGMTWEEIAEALGHKSSSQARKLHRRAKVAIKKRLGLKMGAKE